MLLTSNVLDWYLIRVIKLRLSNLIPFLWRACLFLHPRAVEHCSITWSHETASTQSLI